MSGYSIIDLELIDTHITFIRIDPTDIALTLKDIFESLSNMAWISSFDKAYLRESFKVRAEATIEYIAKNIIDGTETSITSNSGEYVISELARKAVVNLDYLDIPLAELIKIKDVGNHGFDFYSTNKKKVILFGEAKYLASQNSYGKSFKQIAKFENDKQDVSDLIDINEFCCEESKVNFSLGKKGYIAAFASKKTATKDLISGITKNTDFKSISKFEEIICVAVNI